MDLPRKLPDFVIAGAMKCGTTWLHDALNQVDGVFIPRDEVHWIDAGDPLAHPDFQTVTQDGLRLRRPNGTRWFHEDYPDTLQARLFGYDSSTVFHAHVNFFEIAAALPQTRFIVILRNPVARAYSHYWHLVRTGRARFRFEREILEGRQEILSRSIYRANAEQMLAALGSRVLFVCYERIFREPEIELPRITGFLGLGVIAKDQMKAHLATRSNPGRYPRFLSGWLFGARMLAGLQRDRYSAELGAGMSGYVPEEGVGFIRRLRTRLYWLKIAMMLGLAGGVQRITPPMSEVTHAELAKYFSEANLGLDALTGVPFHRYWR